MRKKIYICIGIIFLFSAVPYGNAIIAQSDFQSWNMAGLTKIINPKYSTSLIVINRFTDDVSNFSDVSFDWRIKRVLGRGFSAQYTFRNWTFIDSRPIYFMWYDLSYLHKTEGHRWINLIRFHNGLDWVGKEQADFVRWRNFYFQNIRNSKFTPFIGYDLWYRLNGRNVFQNLWSELGTEYELGNIKLRANYRLIRPFNGQPGLRRHAIVLGAFYSW